MAEMSANAAPSRVNAPAGFWIVSVLSLIWNSYFVVDYVLTQTRNMAYIEVVMGDAQAAIAWIESSPNWVIASWAVSAWGGLAGAVLLLLRSRHAETAFLIALVCVLINSVRQFVALPASLDTSEMMVMLWVILLVAVFWCWYARRARASGILR